MTSIVEHWGLHTGPPTYVGISGTKDLPCRIVRFRRDCVVVRFGDAPPETVHPHDLRQAPRRR
ncbi:hypothetical protein [Gordonia sp. 852002-51296_SCH5728562-b]|uniref:hypothetical protein n=1 Tax=Gordonia sp. 852002-51296_SCH5728562-b TaxID=1834101 RepID=UPI0007E943C1|nr:hypothetical protein [Gordonia sp. 852002-51296_SCH5728562-b]OBA39379.1 hypothetical protein A5766_03435 [Gordonia sp. 852002-51296_SCH5728562-b]